MRENITKGKQNANVAKQVKLQTMVKGSGENLVCKNGSRDKSSDVGGSRYAHSCVNGMAKDGRKDIDKKPSVNEVSSGALEGSVRENKNKKQNKKKQQGAVLGQTPTE